MARLRKPSFRRRLGWTLAGAGVMVVTAILFVAVDGDWGDDDSLTYLAVGFLGWDGGVHRLADAGISGVPLYGGWRHTAFATALGLALLSAALVAAECVYTPRRRSPRVRRRLAWMLAVPAALVTIGLACLALDAMGVWEGWLVTRTGLRHRGIAWARTRPLPLWAALLAAYVGWGLALQLVTRSIRRPYPHVSQVAFIAAVAAAFGAATSVIAGPMATFSAASSAARAFGAAMLWLGVVALGGLASPAGELRSRKMRARWNESARMTCLGCGYDLRGTVAAARSACPECGRTIPLTQQRFVETATAAVDPRSPGRATRPPSAARPASRG